MYKAYWFEKGRVAPSLNHNLIYSLVREPFPKSFDMYCALMHIELKPWQRVECMNMIRYPKYLINWGRGMSKTYLFVLVAVFLAIMGMKVIYLVPRVDELEQPMEYFNANCFVDNNPHKRTDKTFSIKKGMWYHVLGKPMIKISNIDDKGFNVSSGRFNVCMYDECALLMYYAKEVELFNKANGMLRAMDHPHKIWASTPLVGSHFVEMKRDLKKRSPHLMSWRNFENTPDNFLTDTQEKRDQIAEERADAMNQGILYAWETENLALERTASGAAFMNFIEEPFSEFDQKTHNRIGVDFHGYANGHIWVALAYRSHRSEKDVYVIAEGQEKYDVKATAKESMSFLGNPFFDCMLYGEGDITNLVNGPFLKAGLPYGMINATISGHEKYNMEANMLQFTWHIDQLKTPLFYKDFTEAEWADPNKFILHKESSGMKFRNHFIDAAMTALPKRQGRGIYVPNRRLNRRSSIIEEDRRRHNVASY